VPVAGSVQPPGTTTGGLPSNSPDIAENLALVRVAITPPSAAGSCVFGSSTQSWVNVSVPGVPRDFAVEIPLLVSKRGIEGIRTSPLPQTALSHILRDRVATVEIEIDSYVTGNKQRLLELIQMDPWTRSIAQAEQLLEEILAIPENADMAAYFTN